MNLRIILRSLVWVFAACCIGWGCLKMADLAEDAIERKMKKRAEEKPKGEL